MEPIIQPNDVNAKVDREYGYTSAFGTRTWDDIINDWRKLRPDGYEADPNESHAEESDVASGLQHTLQMTGESQASMDPKLPTDVNRVA